MGKESGWRSQIQKRSPKRISGGQADDSEPEETARGIHKRKTCIEDSLGKRGDKVPQLNLKKILSGKREARAWPMPSQRQSSSKEERYWNV